MTTTLLTLDGVTCVLPDGRTLFSDLHESFDGRHTGLVGGNGVGKSVLARILAGRQEPTRGRCIRAASIHYLAQRVTDDPAESVASLAGVDDTIAALERIEAGSTDQRDFDTVGDRWTVREQLRDALDAAGLAHVDARGPAHALSGGEAMRVALLGSRLRDADYLILDEPSNHLDNESRTALMQWLQGWQGGLLVISHDRRLLGQMERIVELSSQGLRSYGGDYAFYEQVRREERQAAERVLEARRIERKRGEQALREQQERQARRQAQGQRDASLANQAPILLGGRKSRSEGSAGKLKRRQDDTRDALSQKVAEAARQVEGTVSLAVLAPNATHVSRRRVAVLERAELPFVRGGARMIDLVLTGGQRVGVVGPNGSGKSTLLQVLAGRMGHRSGRVDVPVASAWLDQRLSTLDPRRAVIEHMREANPAVGEDTLRLRLALLGLDAGKIAVPAGELSGGERLKAALALTLVADPPPQLLLLDEPGNHLDLASLEALETMLDQYDGALVVVSHDEVFLDRLRLTDRLSPTPEGWRMTPW
ncbi:ABC-F family ATP-binding cassette domain-containing protein [Luteibacter sp. W1I16]|uniref:ABC-F family ATP-binding cassette domain-containing protein n=1 Tax=Luteibacter sp. W1I16 TaxID=3373922 RepID=UPI003D1E9A14